MGRRGAHVKQVVHVSEAGGIEAQRLVERLRALPSAKGGMLERAAGGQEAEGRGGGSLSDAQHGPDWGVGGMGRRGVHVKHEPHARDAGGVEGQRLVECIRVLPNPKGGRLRGRQAGQEAGGRGCGSLSDVQHGPDW